MELQLHPIFTNPSFMTYGMIGITTFILAALTVFDSAPNNDTTNTDSYVSQLFNQNNEGEQQQQQETGLISALTGGSNRNKKNTKKNNKRFRKTHHKHRK